MALNFLLRASLSLKLPLSCRALKQLEMAKLRVSFISLQTGSNREERHLRRRFSLALEERLE